jgi:hypothetical protein
MYLFSLFPISNNFKVIHPQITTFKLQMLVKLNPPIYKFAIFWYLRIYVVLRDQLLVLLWYHNTMMNLLEVYSVTACSPFSLSRHMLPIRNTQHDTPNAKCYQQSMAKLWPVLCNPHKFPSSLDHTRHLFLVPKG